MAWFRNLFTSASKNPEADKKLFAATGWDGVERIAAALADGADINARDEFGNTVLMECATQNYQDKIKYLLSRGANPDERTPDGYTALIAACVVGHFEAVELLLEGGADASLKDERGLTAFDFAVDRGYERMYPFTVFSA